MNTKPSNTKGGRGFAQRPTTVSAWLAWPLREALFQICRVLAYLASLPSGGIRIQGDRRLLRNLEREHGRRVGVLVVSNHASMFDIFLSHVAVMAMGRRGYYLAKKELFTNPLVGGLLRFLGAIPLDRSGTAKEQLTALNTASRLIAEGNVVTMYPEGTRSKDYHIGPLRKGPLILAKKGAPVLVVGLQGSREAFESRNIGRSRTVTIHIAARLTELTDFATYGSGQGDEFMKDIHYQLVTLTGYQRRLTPGCYSQ